MISMQKVQPEIKRLQQKYKNDKQKQNEEILKFLPGEQDQSAGGLPSPSSCSSRSSSPSSTCCASIQGEPCPRRVGSTASTSTSVALWCHVPEAAERPPRSSGWTSRSRCMISAAQGVVTMVAVAWMRILLIVGTRWCPGLQDDRPQGRESAAANSPINSRDAVHDQGLPGRVRSAVRCASLFGARRLLGDEQLLADRPAAPGAQQDLRGRQANSLRRSSSPRAARRRRRAKHLRPSKPGGGSAEELGGGLRNRTAEPQSPRFADRDLPSRLTRSEPNERRRERLGQRPDHADLRREPAQEAEALSARIHMEWIEVTGRTVDEAKERALDELGVHESELEFELIDDARTGFLGRIGRSDARIRARIKPLSREKPADKRRRRRQEGRGDGGGGEVAPAPRTATAGQGPSAHPPTVANGQDGHGLRWLRVPSPPRPDLACRRRTAETPIPPEGYRSRRPSTEREPESTERSRPTWTPRSISTSRKR